ncbi:hypothetical protein CGSMWGv6119V5_02971 [Gardnerella vaginalis 6119V5]|nr:hypothetical protein CGSMWGv6119V5_02971 [Gardnerella vaginalis 6119V5]KLR98831.1 hypothetical protein M674_00030 [Neisseria gonorrhoeae SK708]
MAGFAMKANPVFASKIGKTVRKIKAKAEFKTK